MPYRLKGILKLPDSTQVASGVDIEFISRRNYSPLLMDLSSVIKTSSTGAYDITLEYGEYAVVLYWGCNQPSHIGKLFVFADTVEGLDLQTLLQQADWQPATPEYVQQIQGWLAAASGAATSAVESAEKAKASELLVEQDRAEVASNKTIVVNAQEDVTTKHADVVEKAAQVAANTATVNEKVPLAIAAADTASQKAVESSEGAATATDAALRAENAALAMVGAILDGGQCDLSGGFYPPALTVNGKKYSTVWYVQVGGTVAETQYDSGDKLQYTTANDGFYFRIDARDDVVSVNGEKGAVVLTAQKVGADASGTAANIMSQHKSESSAHTPEDVGADPAGTAASAISSLKAEQNPFPQYSDFVSGEPRMFESRAQLAKRSEQYHPLDGQLIARSGDAGLLEAIVAGEVPSCSDSDWLADPKKRSNYTLGDGSTTIRLPDRNGKVTGTIGSVFARGDGSGAPASGDIHGDAMRNFTGSIPATLMWKGVDVSGNKGIINVREINQSFGSKPEYNDVYFGQTTVALDASLQVPTAAQNRPVSISQVWAVKR